MPDGALRVAFLGGVPASLGGGGLELQMRRTARALERRGLEVFAVAAAPEPRPVRPAPRLRQRARRVAGAAPLAPQPRAAGRLAGRRRRPGTEERLLRLSARLPWCRSPRACAASWCAARTRAWRSPSTRRGCCARWAPSASRWCPTASTRRAPTRRCPRASPAEFVLLLGAVSARKRQADTVRALGAAGLTAVVAGGLDGTAAERARSSAPSRRRARTGPARSSPPWPARCCAGPGRSCTSAAPRARAWP